MAHYPDDTAAKLYDSCIYKITVNWEIQEYGLKCCCCVVRYSLGNCNLNTKLSFNKCKTANWRLNYIPPFVVVMF